MSAPLIISDPDIDQLSAKVCRLFKTALIELHKKNKYVVGAWPGGRSLLKFFPGLAKVFAELDPEILRAQQLFQVDERVFGEFNREILEQNFLRELKEQKILTESQIHYFPTEKGSIEGVRQYSKSLAGYGSNFNYVMLGAGNAHVRKVDGAIEKYDCHVAGIFAHHPSSEPHQDPFYYYYDSPKPPAGRVTATYSLLSRSDWCFLFVIGREKEEVLKEFLDKKASLNNTPIKIALETKNCVLITDLKV